MRKGSAAIAISVLIFAGCGGDDDPAAEERPEDLENIDNDAAVATAAPTPTAVPATVEPERLTYTVAEGDLLGTIAQKFDVPLEVLIAVNDIEDANFIQIGDELVIPTQDEVEAWEASQQAEAAEAPAEEPAAEEPATEEPADTEAGSDP